MGRCFCSSRIRPFQPLRQTYAAKSLAFLAVAGFVVGCGGDQGPYQKPTAPVKGLILIDGEVPADPVKVYCHPVDGMDQEHPSVSQCISGEGGRFELSTYEEGDGVPEGEYRLTFQAGKLNLITRGYDGDLFKDKYSDPKTSKVRLTVSGTEPIDMGRIELTTT